MYQFEKLDVWKETLVAISEIYEIAKRFPDSEKYALTSQLKRSVTSIALNIAEGRGSGNDKEFKRFLKIAISSLFETVANLKIAEKLGYVGEKDISDILAKLDQVGAKLKALIKSLDKEKNA